MHRSFIESERRYVIDVDDGSAEAELLDVELAGAFTVGVIIKEPSTRLELNLATYRVPLPSSS